MSGFKIPRRGGVSSSQNLNIGSSYGKGAGFSNKNCRSHGQVLLLSTTWTPKVCEIMAFMSIIRGLGLLFYILWGFR